MSLIFIPKISRYANLYFFIQNLSEWHFSNRKKHNEEWRKELSFPTKIDSYLQEFKKIHEQYSFGEKYLGRLFFLFENPWPEVEILVGRNNTATIKNIFKELEPYFNIIYRKDEPTLNKWVKIIEKPKFTRNSSFINKTLASFYGCALYDKNCSIYLLLSTKEKNGGTSGTINDHSITLELSRASFEAEKHVLNIIWHELIHLYFRDFVLFPLLKKYKNNDQKIIKKVDELIASALLPNGLLEESKLNLSEKNNSKKIFNERIDSKEINQMQELIYPYLQQGKTIDAELVEQICKTY